MRCLIIIMIIRLIVKYFFKGKQWIIEDRQDRPLLQKVRFFWAEGVVIEIKNKRLALNFSQKDLAERIGVPTNTIYKWEKGLLNPSKKNLERLEAVFSGEELDIQTDIQPLKQRIKDLERIIDAKDELIDVYKKALERIAK